MVRKGGGVGMPLSARRLLRWKGPVVACAFVCVAVQPARRRSLRGTIRTRRMEESVAKGYVRFGDVIILYTQSQIHQVGRGYLTCDGIIDDGVRVHVAPKQFPKAIHQCLFQVVPMKQYAAQEEYDEKVAQLLMEGKSKTDPDIKEYLEALKESADKEKMMNEDSNHRRMVEGEIVRYGSTIQLKHLTTFKYLHVDTGMLAPQEKDATLCELTDRESNRCWLTILPRYSVRSVGDDVQALDEIKLASTLKPDQFLHMADQPAAHLKPYFPPDGVLHEGNCAHEASGWTIHLFRLGTTFVKKAQKEMLGSMTKLSTKSLKTSTLVTIFHAETQSYLTCSSKKRVRASSSSSESSETPIGMLMKESDPKWRPPVATYWTLETPSAAWGGDVQFGKHYCLRHFLSGGYLSSKDPRLSLAADKSAGHVSFQTTSSVGDEKTVLAGQSVYMVDREAKGFLTFPDETAGGESRRGAWKEQFTSEDSVRIVPVPVEGWVDLGVLGTMVPFLSECLEYLDPSNYKPRMLTLLISCLKRGLAFVHKMDLDAAATAPDNFDPAYEEGVPSVRSRQVLCREQQLCPVLVRLITKAHKIITTDTNTSHAVLVRAARITCKLSFRFLEAILDEYRENEIYLASGNMEYFLQHIGMKTGAERFITTMLTNNEALLEGKDGKSAIETFLKKIATSGISRDALRFLSEACATRAKALEGNQNLIFEQMRKEFIAVFQSQSSEDFRGSFILAMPSHQAFQGKTCLGSASTMTKFYSPQGGAVFGDSIRGSAQITVDITWSKATSMNLKIGTPVEMFGDMAHDGFVSLDMLSAALGIYTGGNGINDGDEELGAARRIIECFIEQINLYSQLCRDRNYTTIAFLEPIYTYEMCVSVVANTGLHPKIRAAFFKLINALWVDRSPTFEMTVPRLTRVWDNIEEDAKEENIPSAENSNRFILLQEIINNHFEELGGEMNHNEEHKNVLTLEMATCASLLVRFGYYNSMVSLKELVKPALNCLDGRNDYAIPEDDADDEDIVPRNRATRAKTLKKRKSVAKAFGDKAAKGLSSAVGATAKFTTSAAALTGQTLKELATEIAPLHQRDTVRGIQSHPDQRKPSKGRSSILPLKLANLMRGSKDETGSERYTDDEKRAFRFRRNAKNELVADVKVKIMDILIRVLTIATDCRISKVLLEYKQRASSGANTAHAARLNAANILKGVIKSTVGITVEAMGERINLTEICFDLCLYESVEMLNQSVQLMINQNSVMNELLANLQEVQIISNPADADTWEKCNQNVSCIRDSLERHEIWRDLKSAKDLETSEKLHALLDTICRFTQDCPMPRSLQKFYVNAGIIPVLLEFLSLEVGQYRVETLTKGQRDTIMLQQQGLRAIRTIMYRNERNQELVFSSLEQLIQELVNAIDLMRSPQAMRWSSELVVTIAEIFRDHEMLCHRVPARLFRIAGSCLRKKAEKQKGLLCSNDLAIFDRVALVKDMPVRNNQMSIVRTLLGEKKQRLSLALVLFSQRVGSDHGARKILIQKSKYKDGDPLPGLLGYHKELLLVLSKACRGEATLEEVLCKQLISFPELVHAICDEEIPRDLQMALLSFVYDVYIDSGIAGENPESLQRSLPKLLQQCVAKLKVINWSPLPAFSFHDPEGKVGKEANKGLFNFETWIAHVFTVIVPIIHQIFLKDLWTEINEERVLLVKSIHTTLSMILLSRSGKLNELSFDWRRISSAEQTLKECIDLLRQEELFDVDLGPTTESKAVEGRAPTLLSGSGKKKTLIVRKQSILNNDGLSVHFAAFTDACSRNEILTNVVRSELEPVSKKILNILANIKTAPDNMEQANIWEGGSVQGPLWNLVEGPVIKIMRHVAVRTTKMSVSTLERIVQAVAQVMRVKLGARARRDMSSEDRVAITNMCTQLNRLGVTEAMVYLVGLRWGSMSLRRLATKTLNTMLESSHVERADMPELQSAIIRYMDLPVGVSTCKNLHDRLESTISKMEEQRELDALKVKSVPLQKNRGAVNAALALRRHVSDHNDPVACLKLMENICTGAYTLGQSFLGTQAVEEPINFLVLITKYLMACSKSIEQNLESISQGFDALRSATAGPNIENQSFLATETEMVLCANRILRELNEIARANNRSLLQDMSIKQACCCWKKKGPKVDKKAYQLKISSVCCTISESIMGLLEGRKDRLVSNRVLSVLQVSMVRRRLSFIVDYYEKSSDPEAFLAEGVEMMNVLLSLAETDEELKRQLKRSQDHVYNFFLERMGHVEVRFQGGLQKVYFMIPKMCRDFSLAPLKKMWNTCLPRDEIALLKFQDNSKKINDMMSQEMFLSSVGLKRFFGSHLLFYASLLSYYLAMVINILAIMNYHRDEDTGRPSMYPVTMQGTTYDVRTISDNLIIAQGVFSTYNTLAYTLLELPVIYKKRRRDLRKQNASLLRRAFSPLFAAITDFMFLYYVLYNLFAFFAWVNFFDLGPVFSAFHILSILIRNETAKNIVMAVIYPFRQLFVASTVGIYLLYIFSMFNFYFYYGDVEEGECQDLLTCFVYTIDQGTRNGGGIGDVLNPVSLEPGPDGGGAGEWYKRSFYDLSFFILIIIILLNIIFGIIIDTFSDLRSQKEAKEDCKASMCFICGIERTKLDQDGNGFVAHCETEHNKWHYLYYLIHCQYMKQIEPDDMNTYELYVLKCYENDDISWMPLGEAHCLQDSKAADAAGVSIEDQVQTLTENMADLKHQLRDLMEEISSERKKKEATS